MGVHSHQGHLVVNVAFAAVGRRVELLRAFRTAQETLGLRGRLIGLDVDPLAPALRLADSTRIVPPLEDPSFMRILRQICVEEGVDLIFPLIDPMIEVLADNREVIEETGARLAVVPSHSAHLASDKFLLREFFESRGLLTPRSWLPNQLGSRDATFPLFIKPRRGSASHNAFKVENEGELDFFVNYIEDPIIQEYLPGPEITTDVVCDLEGDVLAVISRRRIEVRSGEVSKGVTVYDPSIVAACVEIARALPAIGPITVQCLMKEGKPHFTEINARLGGGVPLAIAAGSDIAAMLLARVAQIPCAIPPLGSYKVGVHMTRFDDSFFIDAEQIKALKDVNGHTVARNAEQALDVR